ncbi:MAG: hypothetical protein NVS4B3_00340 [Gemmatimonadaceae bacterium]
MLDGAALRDPRNRRTLIIAGGVLLVVLLLLAIWYGTGTNRAKHDLASANDRVTAKQHEVDDARITLDQKIAELRAAKAEADAEATKLGGAIERDTRVEGRFHDAGEVTRDAYGRPIRVAPR